MEIIDIAKLCHNVNKAYCESIGDFSQYTWEDAPMEIKDNAIKGVYFHIGNNTTPEQLHENWLKDKIENGWVYGEVKDFDKKTHPCIVNYNELSQEQRSKDYIFKAICDNFKK